MYRVNALPQKPEIIRKRAERRLQSRLEEFGRLHQVMQANKQCNTHWERNRSQYTHQEKPLRDVFTSKDALRWALLVRNIDVWGWKLHLRDPGSSGNQAEY